MEPTEWVEWLRADEQHYDAERAGQWVWFVSNWIGRLPSASVSSRSNEAGVHRQIPHLGTAGTGVSRQRPHLGDAGKGECARRREILVDWMRRLQDRLRNVRVCCGDWSRLTGKTVTWNNAAPCAAFLDPPYSAAAGRDNELYSEECGRVAHDMREWAIAEGQRKDMRIAVCGYEGEHTFPDDWECVAWKAQGGYAHQGDGDTEGIANRGRERVWFSPHCLQVELPLFA